MGLILDTSILIDIEKNILNTISQIKDISKNNSGNASISFMTYSESYFGILGKHLHNQELHLRRLNLFNCVNATKDTGKNLAELKYKYELKGIHFQIPDLIIAAQAKENNLILITKDKLFCEIEEIKTIIIE